MLLMLFILGGCGSRREKADEATAGLQADEPTAQNTDDTPVSPDTDDVLLSLDALECPFSIYCFLEYVGAKTHHIHSSGASPYLYSSRFVSLTLAN